MYRLVIIYKIKFFIFVKFGLLGFKMRNFYLVFYDLNI